MVRKPTARQLLAARIPLGSQFTFITAEIFGPEFRSKPPSFERRVLTVVGFEPRNVNNVVVRDPYGNESLLPADDVEKGLSLNGIPGRSDT